MSKPWVALTRERIDALPAQLGVYEIGRGAGETVRFGYAGGNEPFGMRTALQRELADHGAGLFFRHEFTHGYLTRFQELLMTHVADHGELPPGNADHGGTLGRLSPLADTREA